MINSATPKNLAGVTFVASLGDGPHAVVFRARPDNPEDSLVAVRRFKYLPIHNGDRQRLQDRVAAVSRLGSQEAIIAILRSGFDDDGRLYLITELGTATYADQLAAGPMPLAEVSTMGKTIAEALRAAHVAGQVHGAIKPSNILLSPAGAQMTDFRIDFTTAPRGHIHVPDFAAPEQAWNLLPDPAGDVYSLCATLLTLLQGQAPRRVGAKFPDVIRLQEIFSQPVPRIAGIPEDLQVMLNRGISYEPKDHCPKHLVD